MGQGSGVIYAVADHRDSAALGLQLLDGRDLLSRQCFCPDPVDPNLGRHPISRALVVAGEQDRLHAQLPELFHRLSRGVLDRISNDHQARIVTLNRNQNRSAALSLCLSQQLIHLARQFHALTGYKV